MGEVKAIVVAIGIDTYLRPQHHSKIAINNNMDLELPILEKFIETFFLKKNMQILNNIKKEKKYLRKTI